MLKRRKLSPKVTTETPTMEFLKDSDTLWVNGLDGLIARFGPRGIDIHLGGSCAGGYCTHGKTTSEDWEVFKQKMLEIHGVVVTDKHKPSRLDT